MKHSWTSWNWHKNGKEIQMLGDRSLFMHRQDEHGKARIRKTARRRCPCIKRLCRHRTLVHGCFGTRCALRVSDVAVKATREGSLRSPEPRFALASQTIWLLGGHSWNPSSQRELTATPAEKHCSVRSLFDYLLDSVQIWSSRKEKKVAKLPQRRLPKV